MTDLLSETRGIVFDKDGTLIDLDARWAPLFNTLISRLAERCDDPSLVTGLSTLLGVDGSRLIADGHAAVDTAEQIMNRTTGELVARGLTADVAEQHVVAVAGEAFGAFGPITAIGDLVASLGALRVAGLRIGVATSDDRANTVTELAGLGALDLVDTMRCADDGGPIKPDPAVLVSIAEEWGCGTEALVFVGDSQNDMDTAHAAGCPFVARCDVDRTPRWASDADAVVASIDELVEQ